ncbi:hypothetical protein XENOCAPTIV_016550 [Xenoophorus captivus]|uniref:Uncharacterized protein n=1 Tax=Xenoophorus captivus TaxID=1517983 RepID=A0ABV0QVP2_9TELE
MSTRLMRLRHSNTGSGPVKERDMEDAIQELEARVGMLESQKEVLQNKLSLAKQHILDLGTRTPYRSNKDSGQGNMSAPVCSRIICDAVRLKIIHLILLQLQERILDLEGERDLIKDNYDTLLKRMQQESREGLGFLVPDGGVDDSSRELVNIQASHAETVLELQKTRNLLLLEHKITKDLQVHAEC